MRGIAALLLAAASALQAAPFTPASDSEVVEKLPATTEPAVRAVQSLRRQLAAKPDDAGLRTEIARRYFDLAMAQGDPRYVGYAQATIAPLAQASASTDARYWLVKGLLEQYSHDFDGALKSLARASELDPSRPEPVSWRAAIHMVQARYKEARAECERLAPIADALYVQGCLAYVQAATGQLKPAYEGLRTALAERKDVPAELTLWLNTRLAEMAGRQERWQDAEDHFRAALRTGITDQFLLAAYADFLIARNRAGHAMTLLTGWERSDVLLLRLAQAARIGADPRAAVWAKHLRERFDAAEKRGDRLHEQEAARFALDIEGQPERALQLAKRNYEVQNEPRDAEILLRSAVAAKQPQAAQPVLEWLKSSGYEDPHLSKLAGALK